MIQLHVQTTDAHEVLDLLFGLSRSADSIFETPVGDRIERKLEEQAARHFATEGGSGESGHWAALSPGYAAWKERTHPGALILELTGRLKESIVDAGSPDHVVVREASSLFFGSDVPYGQYHQEGTSKMPRRPPFSPTNEDVREWVDEIRKYFDADVFKGYGRGRTPSARQAMVGL